MFKICDKPDILYRVHKPDPFSELVLGSNLVTREVTSSKEEMVTGICPLASPPFDKTTIVTSSYDFFITNISND